MNNIKNLMIYMWQMQDIDWLGYKLDKGDIFTYHHIIKRCHGGKIDINNGAILTNVSHPYLHIIESRNIEMYDYLNLILQDINDQRHMPSKQQLLDIKDILLEFERKYRDEYTSKGKILLKKEFINRRIL